MFFVAGVVIIDWGRDFRGRSDILKVAGRSGSEGANDAVHGGLDVRELTVLDGGRHRSSVSVSCCCSGRNRALWNMCTEEEDWRESPNGISEKKRKGSTETYIEPLRLAGSHHHPVGFGVIELN